MRNDEAGFDQEHANCRCPEKVNRAGVRTLDQPPSPTAPRALGRGRMCSCRCRGTESMKTNRVTKLTDTFLLYNSLTAHISHGNIIKVSEGETHGTTAVLSNIKFNVN